MDTPDGDVSEFLLIKLIKRYISRLACTFPAFTSFRINNGGNWGLVKVVSSITKRPWCSESNYSSNKKHRPPLCVQSTQLTERSWKPPPPLPPSTHALRKSEMLLEHSSGDVFSIRTLWLHLLRCDSWMHLEERALDIVEKPSRIVARKSSELQYVTYSNAALFQSSPIFLNLTGCITKVCIQLVLN